MNFKWEGKGVKWMDSVKCDNIETLAEKKREPRKMVADRNQMKNVSWRISPSAAVTTDANRWEAEEEEHNTTQNTQYIFEREREKKGGREVKEKETETWFHGLRTKHNGQVRQSSAAAPFHGQTYRTWEGIQRTSPGILYHGLHGLFVPDSWVVTTTDHSLLCPIHISLSLSLSLVLFFRSFVCGVKSTNSFTRIKSRSVGEEERGEVCRLSAYSVLFLVYIFFDTHTNTWEEERGKIFLRGERRVIGRTLFEKLFFGAPTGINSRSEDVSTVLPGSEKFCFHGSKREDTIWQLWTRWEGERVVEGFLKKEGKGSDERTFCISFLSSFSSFWGKKQGKNIPGGERKRDPFNEWEKEWEKERRERKRKRERRNGIRLNSSPPSFFLSFFLFLSCDPFQELSAAITNGDTFGTRPAGRGPIIGSTK